MKQKGKRTLTPKLRFPEFRDAPGWKAEPLGSVSQFVKKKIPLPQLNLDTYVSTENFSPDYGGIEQASKLPPNGSATEYKPDDILIANIRPYLKKVWRSNRSGGASNDVIVIRSKAVLRKDYLPIVIANDAFINYVMKTAKGVKMPRGDIASMKEYIVYYPDPAEQQKIAECLSSLDGLIAAEGRKLASLRDHKRGLMQQLFPQPGQTQPKLRFPEFRDKGEWEEEKLSRHIKLVSGVHLSPSDYSDHGQIPYFTGPSDFTNAESHVSKWTTQTDNKGVAHDILITVKGSGVGELWYLELPQAALGRQLMAVRPSNGVNRFYFQLLLSKRRLFEDLAMGNLIPGLSRGDILNLKTPLPIDAEQQKIADCLTALDTQIAAQAAKIDTLKQHKRGLMQQLFPGPEVS